MRVPAHRASSLARLGAWLARRRLLVLAAALVAVAVSVPVGDGVEHRLSGGAFSAPGSPSALADGFLKRFFPAGAPDLVVVATAAGPVDEPRTAQEGTRLSAGLAACCGVARVESYWSAGRPANLRSRDGRSALIMVTLAGDDDTVRTGAQRIAASAAQYRGELGLAVTGNTVVRAEIERRSEADLRRAELIAAPLVLIVLLLVFRGVVAALLPLLVGAFAVLGTLAVLRGLAAVVPLSVFSINITTALGLGLAIDYSLFVVTRFREELAAGRGSAEAVAATVRTAGRTVVVSALTVSLCLAAMLVFPLFQLRSLGYAGIAVVLLAAAGAVLVLPALLAVLGPRVDALGIRRRRRTAQQTKDAAAPRTGPESGFWYRLATAVMRRPLVCAVPVVAVLLTLGAPFLRLQTGDSDDRVLPPTAPVEQAARTLREQFGGNEASPVSVVLPGFDAQRRPGELDQYAALLSRLPGVTRVDTATGSYGGGRRTAFTPQAAEGFAAPAGAWLTVVSDRAPFSPGGAALVRTLRSAPAPVPVLVGGDAARLLDAKEAAARHLPWALGVVAGTTLLLLFVFTGGVLLPLKAMVLNLLSLTAAFGAMVFVFQEGHLRRFFGDFTVTGQIDFDLPILVFCVAFGLSMDYEIFMLSRIKEEYVRTADTRVAVARGLQATGGLVTAAAVLFALVLAALATSGLTPLKVLGTGLALAVLVDATLVRGVLVPAFMRLAGRANWWAPAPLARLHRLIGLVG